MKLEIRSHEVRNRKLEVLKLEVRRHEVRSRRLEVLKLEVRNHEVNIQIFLSCSWSCYYWKFKNHF